MSYDLVGKDYAVQDHATTLASSRKYLEGALALARAGGAYRTDAEYKDARASTRLSAKSSRFTGVTWDRSCGIPRGEEATHGATRCVYGSGTHGPLYSLV